MSIPELLAPVAAVLAALLAATDRKIERELRAAGAMTADTAVLVHTRTPFTHVRLKRLSGVGAIRPAGDRYYIDDEGWRRWRGIRRRRALTVAALLAAAVGIAWSSGWISFR